jgi:hypothetical protein
LLFPAKERSKTSFEVVLEIAIETLQPAIVSGRQARLCEQKEGTYGSI